MTRYHLRVEIHDDDAGPDDGGRPFAAVALTESGEFATVAAGLGATPWEALADLQADWERIAAYTPTPDTTQEA